MDQQPKIDEWSAPAPGDVQSVGMRNIGLALRRCEDLRLVQGQGQFVDDIHPEGCLYLSFCRATQRGHIVALETSGASAMPGVVAVFTGKDVENLGCAQVNLLLPLTGTPVFAPLAHHDVMAIGQAVAAVIATTPLAAQDGAEAISIRIDSQTQTMPDTAFSGTWSTPMRQSYAGTRTALTIKHAHIAPSPLEPRVALAVPENGHLTFFTATQTPHRVRVDLAQILAIPPEHIRVIAPDVGGAFGGKASIAPEDAMVAFAALHLHRPVKWCATRSEDFLSATTGRGATLEGQITVDNTHKIRALTCEATFPLGYWLPYSAAAPLRNTGRILPGPYVVDSVDVNVTAISAAIPAINIYRGAGRPEAAMLMERLVDEAAHENGLDPLKFRLKNLVAASSLCPHATAGTTDSGNYRQLLTSVCKKGNYPALVRNRKHRRRKGEITGIGLACYIEPCGQGWESARLSLSHDGRIMAATGSTAQGQGRETAAAQIVVDTLGCTLSDVHIQQGDTAQISAGIGALASRSTAIGGSALLLAAQEFRSRLLEVAARFLQIGQEQLVADDKGIGPASPSTLRVSYPELARHLYRENVTTPLLSVEKIYHAPGEAWSSGAVLAAVSIDRETGVLTVEQLVWADDAGTIINPLLVEGQLHGGLAQGYGEALMEALYTDPTGQLLTGSLMDYALPRARDVPKAEILKLSLASVMNPLGAKGVGEAGCIGIPAALVNAAVDALRPFGVRHIDMPMTSEKLWQLMQNSPVAGQGEP